MLMDIPDNVVKAMQKIVDYNWKDERRHFAECYGIEYDGKDFIDVEDGEKAVLDSRHEHIFRDLVIVNDFFEDRKQSDIVDGLLDLYNDNKLSERDECAVLNALDHLGYDISTI